MRDLFNGTAKITDAGICFVLIKYYILSLIKWYNYKISNATAHTAAAALKHSGFTKVLLLLQPRFPKSLICCGQRVLHSIQVRIILLILTFYFWKSAHK